MADITVQRGQGVTQAIASNLGLSTNDCKNIKLSIWQQVMTLVDKNNSQALKNNKSPIFTGTNDVSKISDKSTYQTNFLVLEGQTMNIDDGIFAKIKQLLTGNATAIPQQLSELHVQNSSQVSRVQNSQNIVESKNKNLTLEQNQAKHKEVVDASVKFIEDNFAGSPLEGHFSSEEDKKLFLDCLKNIQYDKEKTGAGTAQKGVIHIETNNENVNSKEQMTKLLIHEANHAFLQRKALENGTLNFPTKAEEIECEILALSTMAHFVKNKGMNDYQIYEKNISEFSDKSFIQNDSGFRNWLNGYNNLADNLQGDITIQHSLYKRDNNFFNQNSVQDIVIHIKSGDVVKIADQQSFVIGKSAFFEGVDDTAVAQLIMHNKDFSTPELLAPGRIVFDGLGAADYELKQAIDDNFNINNYELIPVTIERRNPQTGQFDVVHTAKAYRHK